MTKRTDDRRLPGDLTQEQKVARALRVDHAGEYGAARIYDGQLAVLGATPSGRVIREMAAQEREHLETFDRLLVERHVRPTALMPIWHVAGFALGAATAIAGPKTAMACTVAVEEVIVAHYQRQTETLGNDEAELKATIEEFRQDEVAHRDTALSEGAEAAPAYPVLTGAIKAGTRLAIWLSERV